MASGLVHAATVTAVRLILEASQRPPAPFFGRGYARRMRRGSNVLLIAVLAMLIVVNVVLLFLLIRPDRILTARPRIRTQAMVVRRRRHSGQLPRLRHQRRRKRLLSVPTPRRIRRLRVDQSSRFLSNGCSWPYLPRRRGAPQSATATPPARSSGQLTAARAGNESLGLVPLRSCRLGARAKRRAFHHWRYTWELLGPLHGLCQRRHSDRLSD